jgi:hypothetical protein
MWCELPHSSYKKAANMLFQSSLILELGGNTLVNCLVRSKKTGFEPREVVVSCLSPFELNQKGKIQAKSPNNF